MRRLLFVVALAVTAGAAAVSYALVTLPEPGDVRRPVVPFRDWLDRNVASPKMLAEQCETVNQAASDRTWCFRQQIADARRSWRGSAGMKEVWLASEIAPKRALLLVGTAYALFVLVLGLLCVRVVVQLARHRA